MASQSVINLPAGKVLTVSAGAASAGHIHRKALAGSSVNYLRVDLFESVTRIFGPFSDDRDYLIVTEYGPALSSSIGVRPDNNVVNLEGDDVPIDNVQASLATALTGDDNDLVFTAVPAGAAGNRISIQYRDPAANDVALSVAVNGTPHGTAIVFTLATDGGGAITTVADDITALVESDLADFVTVANAEDNDGSVEVTAMAVTHLADGVTGTGTDVAGPGSRFTDYTNANLYINAGTKAAPVWKLVTRAA
jgi:hypothetical protein